jgi:hypothetical protein
LKSFLVYSVSEESAGFVEFWLKSWLDFASSLTYVFSSINLLPNY